MVKNGGNFWRLKSEMIVKGIYLAGAKKNFMPSVDLDPSVFLPEGMWYRQIEDSNGVKVMFQNPLKMSEIGALGVWLEINAAHPFCGMNRNNSVSLNIHCNG